MSGIAIAVPYVPFPTRSNGLSVRLAPVLDVLGSKCEVHLVVVGDRHARFGEGLEEARRMCSSATLIDAPLSRWHTRYGLIRSALHRPVPPKRLLHALTTETLSAVDSKIARHKCAALLSVGDVLSHSALLLARKHRSLKHVIDWVDSPSLHLVRVGGSAAELCKLSAWERMVNHETTSAVYISSADAGYANDLNSEKIKVIPNGLVDDFPVERELSWRRPLSQLPKLTLGFLGNMGYGPNDRAATTLCRDILPEVQRELGSLAVGLRIIGKNPSEELRAYGGEKVEITGYVEEIWSAMEGVDVFIFPMEHGAGMQNKVVEAMRSHRPVVASSICLNGLPESQRARVVVADSDRDIALAVRELVESPPAIQRVVEGNLSYLKMLQERMLTQAYASTLLG